MANISISQMNTRAEANLSDLHEVAYADGNSQTGYASGKMTMEVMANAIVNDFAYQSLGNKTVKGAIEDAEVTVDTALDPTSTNAVQNRAIAHELAGGNTQASGDVVTISDGSNLALTSATSTLAPIQDLHGYSNPWVGGAGVNLWDEQWESGVYTIAIGSAISKSNNANYIRAKNIISVAEGTTYFFKLKTQYDTIIWVDDNDIVLRVNGVRNDTFSYTGTPPQNAKYVVFYSYGTTYNNDICINVSNPTINGTYYPYSNICPISGYDSASLTILDDSTKKQYFEGLLNGTYGFVDLGTLTWSYMESGSVVAPYFATTGVTNCKSYGNPSSNSINAICTDYKVTKRNVSDFVNGCLCGDGTDTTVTVIEIKDSNYTDATVFKNALSGIYLIYELATPTTTTITSEQYETLAKAFGGQGVIVEFGNTIYSGVIDWCTGVVTVDKAMVDLGTLTWDANLSLNIFYAYVNGMKQPATQAQRNQGIMSSNYYASTTTVIDATMPNGTMLKNNSSIYIKDVSYNSVANFETAMDGVQLCYELATPTTIQLTPTQLKTLAGYNTIYTDVGNISIAYQPNNVIAECKEYTDNAISNELSSYIPPSVFDGKKVLFIGDSFMEGFGARVADGLDSTTNPITTPAVADSTPMRGWAKTFQERYPKAIVHNISIYGATIAYQNNAPSVMGQLTYIATNSIGGEYVVLDGGANDVFQGITKGSAKADDVYEEMNWDTMNYNTYQTIPCLEAIFAIFAEHFPTVRLLYVSPPPMDVTLTEEMQTAMDTMNTEIEALCEKWGVKYIKIIGKGSKNTIYSNNTEYYTASDKIHPLQRFYDETIGQIDEVLKQF